MLHQYFRFQLFPCAFQILLFSLVTAAQYRFETWTTAQGLPYKTVNSVLQTHDGYVWAATGDGLARFDGVKFTGFNTANSPGLLTNRLKFLAETADGSVWTSGEESGLFRYQNGEFSSFFTDNDGQNGKILSLYADKAANRLLILTEKELSVWRNEKFVRQDLPISIKPYFALLDNTGALCVKQDGVVRRFAPDGNSEYNLSADSPESLLTMVHKTGDGAVWIGTFYRHDPRRATLYTFKNGEISIVNNLPAAFINQILEDRKGNVWLAIGSQGKGGLSQIENGKIRAYGKDEGFFGSSVSALLEDREGGIWAATADNGLTRFGEQLITSFTRRKNGLSSDNIYPLYEDADGIVWLGAWRDGLEKRGGLDKYENGVFTNFATKGQITSYLVTAIFKDRDGVLWIGAYGGVTRYKDGKFTQFTKKNNFVGEEVYAITQDFSGNLWFGTEAGLTVLRAGAFTNFTTADGLPHNEVKFLLEATDKTLWIATRGGLASLKDGQMTNYRELPAIQIRSIYEDADGTLWFGTYDGGLIRRRNGEFRTITVKDGLSDNGAFQILEDDFGRFWISSNRGIYRVNKQELNDFADGKTNSVTSVAYSVEDGMLDAESNGGVQPAGFKSRTDGRLWFPTQKGVVVIDPKALPINLQPPNVVIENCLLDRAKVSCGDIKILPENDALEINYTGLSFVKPEQLKFRYKLDGLDKNWTDAGTRRTANFTHLPPGDYTFRVTAANVDGVWNETGATLKISVKPPFYRTFWFLAVCVIGLITLVAVIFNSRIRNLEKAHAAQEEFSRRLLASQESERQRIAAELHDSLGQDLLIIKNWALLGLQNGTNSREQLSEISETASAAIDGVREIAYNLRPFHLDELGLTKAIESMLNRVSKATTINFVWEIDLIDKFFPHEAEINFYRIVQELVNNIVKHSGATEANVNIKRGDAQLRLAVRDNGRGFDTDKLSSVRANHSGFGLAGIGERARILGGKIVVDSSLNRGTIVKLTIVK